MNRIGSWPFTVTKEGRIMRTIYVGGEHEVRCDGKAHWTYWKDSPPTWRGPCDCPQPDPGPLTEREILEALDEARRNDHPRAFTKQHHEAIAAIIHYRLVFHKTKSQPALVGGEGLVKDLCLFFEADDPLFDRQKFWDACFKEASDG